MTDNPTSVVRWLKGERPGGDAAGEGQGASGSDGGAVQDAAERAAVAVAKAEGPRSVALEVAAGIAPGEAADREHAAASAGDGDGVPAVEGRDGAGDAKPPAAEYAQPGGSRTAGGKSRARKG